ncbi:MAG: hypothetical protein WDN31_01605 [Hyphomicrobium sp.]
MRIVQAAIGDDPRAVRSAHRAERLSYESDLVAIGGRDVAVCLHEHVDRAGDIERLHALDDEDGNGPGRHRYFSRIALAASPALAETRVTLAGIRWPHLLRHSSS